MSRVRVFLATSLDGFLAGPDDQLDWLPGHGEGAEDTFSPFFAEIGAMLMGRRTYEIVAGFPSWPYGQTPVLVASARPLPSTQKTVRRVEGPIEAMVQAARQAAGGRDVYLDGGALVRSALEAGLVDELTLTLVPVALGRGKPLFAGLSAPRSLRLRGHRAIGAGMVQLVYAPS